MEPKLTQRMSMHLNGGSEFSLLTYDVLADNKETGISRSTKTNGRPKYLKVSDDLHFGEETFDILETKGVGMKEWILARLPASARG